MLQNDLPTREINIHMSSFSGLYRMEVSPSYVPSKTPSHPSAQPTIEEQVGAPAGNRRNRRVYGYNSRVAVQEALVEEDKSIFSVRDILYCSKNNAHTSR